MTRPTLALVLGGGGSRGLAHIGVLEVLQREHIPIDRIVATSMGGIVGVLFALGLPPDQIAQWTRRAMVMVEPQPYALRNVRLLSSRARQQWLRKQFTHLLEEQTFADLRIPVTLMTVNMLDGTEVPLTTGPLVPALLATTAVPGLFPPVPFGDMQLADGGVIDSLATHVAVEQGADKIIAVDVYPALTTDRPWSNPVSAIMGFQLPLALFSGADALQGPNMFSSMWRSVRVMTWHLHQKRLADDPPDILLRPRVDTYGSLDFKDMDGPLQAGVEAAEERLADIKALCGER
ncbi:MAG: patatin-like phospholipase family protein [Herpetosiphonaceae bacterium]|nr:patatin-like phospholipase family protein [Herpetosiphonaceae bacterium]